MSGPLRGAKVLDLSRLAPGPYCAMLLADLGADVVRIDAPNAGSLRIYEMLARNKRSVVLDLKSKAGQKVLHRLVESADILLEGNRPGVTQRLAADDQTLRTINPSLIYCSLTGYGQEGPMAQAAGHDINYIALAGVLSQIGDGKNPPMPPLNLVADYGGGGLLAAFGIVAALFERERNGTGEGQTLDVAMIDGSASLMAAHYSTGGAMSEPGRGLLGGGAPFYGCYECSDGGYVAVGAIEPQFFEALCQGTGLDFTSDQMERDQWPAQKEAFRKVFASKTRDAWMEIFDQLDACVSPVLDLEEAPRHPHNVARQGFLQGPDGTLQVAPAPRFSRSQASIDSPAPRIGEHTKEVLQEAGLSDQDIEEFAEAGAFGGLRLDGNYASGSQT